MLGLGLTALLASFMSGMAGNVTAFNTVWTYDIYQAHIRKGASDAHYPRMGRAATVGGILLSVAAAYVAGGPDVVRQLGERLPPTWKVTLKAAVLSRHKSTV